MDNGFFFFYYIFESMMRLIYVFTLCTAQDSFLAYSPDQHPIVLQIGGRNLDNLAKATKLANAYGYDEINFKYECLFL